MILYEFEGKKLLSKAGITVPNSQLFNLQSSIINLTFPVVLKAQVLSGKRADAGGILFAENDQDAKDKIQALLGSTINKEKVESVLVEEKVKFEKEYYLSLSYDTDERAPVLTYSQSGGTGIEEREVKKVKINPISQTVILNPPRHPERSSEGPMTQRVSDSDLKHRRSQDLEPGDSSLAHRNDKISIPSELLQRLINLFFDQDCLLLEINPLVKTENGWMALDAKIKLDDTALGRHKDEWNFSPRSAPGHTPTKSEIEAKKIDEGDYRGVAGSAFFELDGDIAIMSSGGGASLTALDALLLEGGKPANYTEYSGNPPKEKVLKLTKVVLSKPNLHGLWIVGAVANFTDVYETLSGIIDGLRELEKEMNTKFDFPIVIRRGGPRDKEAFDMLKQVKDFDLHLYGEETSITQAAKIMTDLAKEYASHLSS